MPNEDDGAICSLLTLSLVTISHGHGKRRSNMALVTEILGMDCHLGRRDMNLATRPDHFRRCDGGATRDAATTTIGRFEKQKNASASGDFSCAALLIRVGQALQPRLLDWQNPFKSDRYFLVAVTHAASLSDDHLAVASIDSNSSGYSFSSSRIT